MGINNQAIGIFDSGAGGLTVASAVKNILPDEKIIYFGDTAHLPYGDKSQETIQKYSLEITDFLLRRNCKVILIACNTASAAAYERVKTYVGDKAIVINVIDPAAEYVANVQESEKIGVIGTKATIRSESYPQKINKKAKDKVVVSLATPLLVPMIEEAFVYDDISNAIIRKYLSDPELQGIDSLILGCTHYPIIKNQIRKFYEFETTVIDSSIIAAKKLKEILEQNNLLNTQKNPEHEFYLSDFTDSFEKLAVMFFDKNIDVQVTDVKQ
ncbi:MAG: glutamate racemase [Bacteroidota bacterium]|nr:glutamate racemase [Bacteroidota bacterium]